MDYDNLYREVVRIRVLLEQVLGDKSDYKPSNVKAAQKVIPKIGKVEPKFGTVNKVVNINQKSCIKKKGKRK